MVWIEGETMPKMHRHEGFIRDLAVECAVLHSNKEHGKLGTYQSFQLGSNLERDNRLWLNNNSFVESALNDFRDIEGTLTDRCVLHGDLWNENVIVDEDGRLTGLIDWEHSCIYDPHWEFRMIRRFIGWDGLQTLIYYYNKESVFNVEYETIKILDKFWMCHQYIYRIKKEDKSSELFKEYIDRWPECLYN